MFAFWTDIKFPTVDIFLFSLRDNFYDKYSTADLKSLVGIPKYRNKKLHKSNHFIESFTQKVKCFDFLKFVHIINLEVDIHEKKNEVYYFMSCKVSFLGIEINSTNNIVAEESLQ